jgi:hypothetical protein
MVRPLIPLTVRVAPAPLRDAEPDDPAADPRADASYRGESRAWHRKLVWMMIFLVGLPLSAALVWAFDYASLAIFGGLGTLVRPLLGFLTERLYFDD